MTIDQILVIIGGLVYQRGLHGISGFPKKKQ